MSIYLFKTEDFYGGETKVFTDKATADEYLETFIQRTESKVDAVIEEHTPIISANPIMVAANTPPRQTAVSRQRPWKITVYNRDDQHIFTTVRNTLKEVAALFDCKRACDLSHLLYHVHDEATRKAQMLNRWNIWFCVEREEPEIPLPLRTAMQQHQQQHTERKRPRDTNDDFEGALSIENKT